MSVETVVPITALRGANPAGASRGLGKENERSRDPVTATVIVAIITAVLFLLVLLPLVTILARAFSADGLKVLTSFASSTTNRTIALNTVVLGAVVGLIRNCWFLLRLRAGASRYPGQENQPT